MRSILRNFAELLLGFDICISILDFLIIRHLSENEEIKTGTIKKQLIEKYVLFDGLFFHGTVMLFSETYIIVKNFKTIIKNMNTFRNSF